MSTKRESLLQSTFRTMNRRRVLEGLGALAATTACSSSTTSPDGGAGAPGAGGAGAGNVAGAGPSPGGGGQGGSGVAGAAQGGAAQAGAAQGGAAHGGAAQGGAAQGGAAQAGAAQGGGSAAGAGGGGSSAPLVAPSFDGVPNYCMATPTTCAGSPTDGAGQGPFFIHDLEKDDDIPLFRQDIRGRYNPSAAAGVEMQLHVRLLTSSGTGCDQTPLADAEVYIWHTDAQGFYSGFGTHGGADEQKPDKAYSGTPGSNNLENTDRFCRGAQTTDSKGIVSFRSIFPGWYNGRVLHIHLVAFKKGSKSLGRSPDYSKTSSPQWLYTTQFYFDSTFVRSVHEMYEPYKTRTMLADYAKSINSGTISSTTLEGAGQNCLGTAMRTESTSSGLIAKATLANDIVTAQINVLLKA